MISEAQLYDKLQQQFGFQSFRPGQLEALTALTQAHNALAILPTGAGKTLIYELYGAVTQQLVLIVSPLISLMQDQVNTMNMQGEKRAAALTSMMSYPEKQSVLTHLSSCRYLFVSPEMLSQPMVLTALSKNSIGLMVVDEAHCISTWGPDFRPEYLLLGQIRHRLGDPLTLMVTATATDKVKADIKQKMQLTDADEIVEPVDRQNLFLDVEQFETQADKDARLVELIATIQKPGVIYFSSKKRADEVAEFLAAKTSCRVAAYHADLDTETRFKVQQQFMLDQLDVICATSAFGMGIDKNNVRFVIHYHMPGDLESYWQEIGRAGRDGQQAIAILLYQVGDEQVAQFLSEASVPQPEEINYYYQQTVPAIAGDEKAALIDFYKQHHVSRERALSMFASRRTQRQAALQKMLRYVRTPKCKRQYVQQYFDQTDVTSVSPCCSIDSPEVNLATLGLKAQMDKPVNPSIPSWQTILSQLFSEMAL